MELNGEEGEFVYHYQPIISTDHGHVCDVEALVRFQKRDGTLVPPVKFIPQMEEDGSIDAFSRQLFPDLIRAIARLSKLSPVLRLSFNLSAQSLEHEDLSDFLLQVLDQESVSPRSMQLEILESGVLQQNPVVEQNLRDLAEQGMSIAMDDYGTGYSSIDTLSLWPFGVIKLDRMLVNRMVGSQKATTIVEASIHMAHKLGIQMVAEGVETQSMFRFLTSTGCDKIQGYWIARPMPLDEVEHFIRDNRSHACQTPPVGLIMQAQMDHLEWRRQLMQELQSIQFEIESGEERVAHRLPELSHHHCRFGRWYYSANEAYTQWPQFEALREPHREFHQFAEQLIEGVKQGHKGAELEGLLQELDRKTIRMIELLQQLEMKAFIEFGAKPEL